MSYDGITPASFCAGSLRCVVKDREGRSCHPRCTQVGETQFFATKWSHPIHINIIDENGMRQAMKCMYHALKWVSYAFWYFWA
jgi:hypothetical protein